MSDREMRQVLAEMALLSYGPTTRFDKSGGRSSEHPGGKQPSGDSNPLHEIWAERWAEAPTAQTLQEAREALESVRKRVESAYTEETEAQLYARIVKEGEGWPIADVARSLSVTATQVRKARRQHKREVEFGKVVVDALIVSREDRVLSLYRQGLSSAQISAQTEVKKQTVLNIIRRAA